MNARSKSIDPRLFFYDPESPQLSDSDKENDSDSFEECQSARSEPESQSECLDAQEELKFEISILKDQILLMDALLRQILRPHQIKLLLDDLEFLNSYLPKRISTFLVKDKLAMENLLELASYMDGFALDFMRRFDQGIKYCDLNKLKRRSDGVNASEVKSFIFATKFTKACVDQIYELIDIDVLKRGIELLRSSLRDREYRLSIRENKLKNSNQRKPLLQYKIPQPAATAPSPAAPPSVASQHSEPTQPSEIASPPKCHTRTRSLARSVSA